MTIRPLHAALAVAAGAVLFPVIRKKVRNHREANRLEHDESGTRNGRDAKDSARTQRASDNASVGHRASNPVPTTGGQRAATT
jgi:hypothetical protein